MNLYDTVFLEYPLDIPNYVPQKVKSIMQMDFAQNGFHTKGLKSDLSTYEISNNGKLYLISDPFLSREKKSEQIYHHGYIDIYTVVLIGEGRDIPLHQKRNIWVSYNLKFTDGWLVEAKCTSPTELDAESLELAHI